MMITKVAEINKFVVKWQGNAFWFDTEKDARSFMENIENKLLFL